MRRGARECQHGEKKPAACRDCPLLANPGARSIKFGIKSPQSPRLWLFSDGKQVAEPTTSILTPKLSGCSDRARGTRMGNKTLGRETPGLFQLSQGCSRLLQAHGGGEPGRGGRSPGDLQGQGDPAEEQKELAAARPEAKRVCRSPRGAACSRARPRARGKGEQRAQARADTAVLRTSVQGRAGASRTPRGSPHGSPGPRGTRVSPPCSVWGAGSCAGGAQVWGGGSATSLQARACVRASKTPLLPPPPPRCTKQQRGPPRDAAAAHSHRRERSLALSPSSCSVPPGVSDLSSQRQPGSAQCFHQRAPRKHRARFLSPPGHAGRLGLPEPSRVLRTAAVISSGQKRPPSPRGEGQRPTWLFVPYARLEGSHPCQGTRVMEGKEIPAKTLILFFKNKKKTQNRQNFLKTASYLIISQKLAWKHHLLSPCSRTCFRLCPFPSQLSPPGRRQCQPIVPRGSAPHPIRPQRRVPVRQGRAKPLFPSTVAPRVPGRGARGFGQPQRARAAPAGSYPLLTPVGSCSPPKKAQFCSLAQGQGAGHFGGATQQRGCRASTGCKLGYRFSASGITGPAQPPGTHRLWGSARGLYPSRQQDAHCPGANELINSFLTKKLDP